jgi:phosphohistidine phosphatase
MGKRLKKIGVEYDALISSTAVRAQQTAEIIANSIGWPIREISFGSNLYHASATELQNFISHLQDNSSRVVLFGHNPGMTNLVTNLWGLSIDNIPTCGLVRLEFSENSWKEVSSAIPVRAQIDFPKNLSGEPIPII